MPPGRRARAANLALRRHGLPEPFGPLAHPHASCLAAARARQDGDLELGGGRQSRLAEDQRRDALRIPVPFQSERRVRAGRHGQLDSSDRRR